MRAWARTQGRVVARKREARPRPRFATSGRESWPDHAALLAPNRAERARRQSMPWNLRRASCRRRHSARARSEQHSESRKSAGSRATLRARARLAQRSKRQKCAWHGRLPGQARLRLQSGLSGCDAPASSTPETAELRSKRASEAQPERSASLPREAVQDSA